ncbi:MAG TPA: hypothetical protein VF744_13470 [Beijerinckiaceae bacterium]
MHTTRGTLCLTAVEDVFHEAPDRTIEEPWVGFIHQVPKQTLRFPDLERLVALPGFQRSLKACRGLWSLTNYQRQFLRLSGIDVPISVVRYPGDHCCPSFSIDEFRGGRRTLLLIGEFLRRYQTFYDLDAPNYRKIFLAYPGFDPQKYNLQTNESVHVRPRVSQAEYDELLSKSLVFLDLLDAGANTTVVECIIRNTPLLIRKIGGVPEYLGDNYPLYFDSTDEAAALAADDQAIDDAHRYLNALPKDPFTYDGFSRAIQDSLVYRLLPCPAACVVPSDAN